MAAMQDLPLLWGLPFAGLLLTIALAPLLAERFWHHHAGKLALAWSVALLLPWAHRFGTGEAAGLVTHAALEEYLPFLALIFALFTVGGGIVVQGGPWGTPAGNTLLLAIGTVLASIMGTTGAAMVLIHPLLRANAHRVRKVHLGVFFILLVGNVGGALSPLGDPPLFLGFLRGVPFFWPTLHMLAPMALLAALLLGAFYLVDRHLAAGDGAAAPEPQKLHLLGWANIGLLAGVVATVLMQGVWQPGQLHLGPLHIGIERLVGMALLVALGLVSLRITPNSWHRQNMFSWAPFQEVAKLFAAIFVTMAPVVAMLRAGEAGALSAVVALANQGGEPVPVAYFWLTGVLSAFLDNAPTYLVFFELAGGDPAVLTGPRLLTLEAISAGAVFFGALTYIGNAPNFMVRSICAHRGVHMPGFIGYMGWSLVLMLPGLALVTLVFF